MLVFYTSWVDFGSNFEGRDPYENIYIYIYGFVRFLTFQKKLLKKAPGDPKLEPKSVDFREKLAKNRQNCEKKIGF